jgi:tRNA nucleotidyltransferase/poly(A) polymerase
VWIVGGAIRDFFLGLEAKDWDLATDAAPTQVIELFPRTAPVGLRHGTVQVLTPDREVEVTTVPGSGAEGVQADLGRRDFTVNAMAWAFPQGVFLDPHGGRRDLGEGRLCGVGDAAQRFREDPLRTLRAGRFVSTCGLRIEAATFEALKQEAAGLIRVAPERIREEWLRLLLGRGMWEGVVSMWRGGVIRVTLPEMVPGDPGASMSADLPAPLLHAAATAHHSPPRAAVRLAAFFHDLSHAGGSEAADPAFASCLADPSGSARIVWEILTRWRASTRDRRDVTALVANQLPATSFRWSGVELRRALSRLGRDLIRDWVDLGEAHASALGATHPQIRAHWPSLREEIFRQLDTGFPLRVNELAVSGLDVMEALGIPPGETVGRVLGRLHEMTMEDPTLNEHKFLMDFLRKAYHK